MKKYEIEITRGAKTESSFVVHADLIAALNLFVVAYGDFNIKEIKYIEDVAQEYPFLEYNPDIESLLREPNV